MSRPDDITARVAAYRALLARVGETPVCGCCSEALVDEHFPWAVDAIDALTEQVRTLREALGWECEARDRAFTLAGRHEATAHERDALLRALALRQAVHDITCPRRFCRDEDCTCRLAPWTAEEVAP